MAMIKSLLELKRNVVKFNKWFEDNPTIIPTFKIFYELLGVNHKFVKNIKQLMASTYNVTPIGKPIGKPIDTPIGNTIGKVNIGNMLFIGKTMNKTIGEGFIGNNEKEKEEEKEKVAIYEIITSCEEKMHNEFWHRAINCERKYLNPRLIEMYHQMFMEKKEKADDNININIKIDNTEVSIKK